MYILKNPNRQLLLKKKKKRNHCCINWTISCVDTVVSLEGAQAFEKLRATPALENEPETWSKVSWYGYKLWGTMQCCLFLSCGKSQRTKFRVFSEAMPSPSHTCRQLTGTARDRAEGLQLWGAGTGHHYASPRVTGTVQPSVLRSVPLGHCLRSEDKSSQSWTRASCPWLQKWFEGVCGDRPPEGM